MIDLQKEAVEGDPFSQYLLATEFFWGNEVEKDLKKCFFWYALSCKAGYTSAKWNAGIMLFDGDGIPADRDLGFSLIYSAAQAGHHGAIDYLDFLKNSIPNYNDTSPNFSEEAQKIKMLTFSDPISVFETLRNRTEFAFVFTIYEEVYGSPYEE